MKCHVRVLITAQVFFLLGLFPKSHIQPAKYFSEDCTGGGFLNLWGTTDLEVNMENYHGYNMEPKNEGCGRCVSFFNFVIVRFHIGFPGCIHETWDNDSLSQWLNFMLSRKNTAFKRLYLRVHWLSEMNFH